ncbi:transposase [Candidatus Woesearchaeota archaeon]|nr:transposase [Candidatus Woesearchaeota archaeon]
MLKTYKFRIYPNKKQEIKLLETLNLCRFTYNKQLELKINKYKENKVNLTQFDLNNNLIILKEENKELKQIHSQTLQDINKRISLAFNGFYRRLNKREQVGFPRFKSKYRYDSITYPQSGFKLENQLYISKIGQINIIKHREIEGKVKTLTIKKTSTNKWFACFSVEQESKSHSNLTNEETIGIDLGINHFYADSNGNLVDNPKYLRKSELKLKKLQRKHSKKLKGSNNRNKSRLKLANLHELISNQRNDFLHKQSRQLVNNYNTIVVERLQISNMTKNHYLAKSINDASWNKFLQLLSYKVEETGGKLVEIDPRNTSQLCICGNKVEKSLATRVHRCNNCGIEMDRDLMSALIIKEKGINDFSIITVGTTGIQACQRTSIEVQ